MSTYRELVNMVLDELKMVSDDSLFQQEHVIFLLDKYRGFLLKQRYSDIKKEIPESNYQTICVELEKVPAFQDDTCGGRGYLKSKDSIPNMMTISSPKVSTLDLFQGNITYTNKERFKYVGSNKYLQNIIYSTIAPDEHLYLKSNNPQAYYLNKVKVTGLFEDSAKAAELACPGDDKGEETCDVLDRAFPLEEALIPTLLELLIKDLSTAKYQAADQENNASDELGKLANFIARHLKKGVVNYE